MRGVPRLRAAISAAPASSIGTPRIRAERRDDEVQVGVGVEVEPVHDAEAAAQRRGEEAGAGGGADQGEGLQRDLHRARAGPAADHEVEAVVLERGVEDLLDLRVEAVDLVDEQDLAVVEGGEERGQVARPLDDGPGGGLDRDAELGRDHVGEARLADARRPEEQDVVEGLAAAPGGLDGDPEVGDHLRLADVLVEPARAQRDLEAEVVVDRASGDEAGRSRWAQL